MGTQNTIHPKALSSCTRLPVRNELQVGSDSLPACVYEVAFPGAKTEKTKGNSNARPEAEGFKHINV